MNSWSISGRLGHSPKLRALPNGDPVLNLSVAVARSVKKDGQWIDATIWTDVTLFGRNAKWLSENLRTGMLIGATGELGLRTYTARDGTTKTQLELFATKVEPLEKVGERARDDGASRSGNVQHRDDFKQHREFDYGNDDLPF